MRTRVAFSRSWSGSQQKGRDEQPELPAGFRWTVRRTLSSLRSDPPGARNGWSSTRRRIAIRILIIGGGEIGYALCAALSAEHDVFVVDSDPEVAGRFAQVESQFVQGSGTNPEVLRLAEAESCDLFIACTGLDEVNIVACSMGS